MSRYNCLTAYLMGVPVRYRGELPAAPELLSRCISPPSSTTLKSVSL